MDVLKLRLLTGRLRLRAIEDRDAAATAALMSPAISRWTGSWPEAVSAADVVDRIAKARARMARNGGLDLAIVRGEDEALLGWIGVGVIETNPRRANLGYWIGEAFFGRGYAAEAAAATMTAAWTWLDIDVIEAGAQPENAASLAILRRLGMRETGPREMFAAARGRLETCVYFEIGRPDGGPGRGAVSGSS
jgi:ribosomal-protein-alanine N-acetyltransferase